MIRRGKLSVANAHPHQANSQSGRARHSVFRNQMGFTKTHTHTHTKSTKECTFWSHDPWPNQDGYKTSNSSPHCFPLNKWLLHSLPITIWQFLAHQCICHDQSIWQEGLGATTSPAMITAQLQLSSTLKIVSPFFKKDYLFGLFYMKGKINYYHSHWHIKIYWFYWRL